LEDKRFVNRSNFNRRKPDDHGYNINQYIRAKEVRLVGDNIENPGVVSIEQALKMGDEMNLDLVEISPNAEPPVCKLVDFQKFLYQQKKKQKEQKAKTLKVIVKEIRFSPHTDDHDYNFKMKHAEKFLKEGAKVKAFVFFKGRTIVHKQHGEVLLTRFIKDLEEVGKIEKEPFMEGKRLTVFMGPKK
jgi:translation initiation factor IF-3